MIKSVAKISEQTANTIRGIQFITGRSYNPVQDSEGNWIISLFESSYLNRQNDFFSISGYQNEDDLITSISEVVYIDNSDLLGIESEDATNELHRIFSLTDVKRVIFGKDKTYTLNTSLNVREGVEVDLNGSTLIFKIASSTNDKGVVMDDDSIIRNGTVEIRHNTDGADPDSGEFLAPIGAGIYSSPIKSPNNILVENIKTITNAKSIGISFLGATNCTFRNIIVEGQTHGILGIQHHWANTGAYQPDGNGGFQRTPNEFALHPHNNIIENLTVQNCTNSAIFLSGCYKTELRDIKMIDGSTNDGITISAGEFGYSAVDPNIAANQEIITTIDDVVLNPTNGIAVRASYIGLPEFNGVSDVPIGTLLINNLESNGSSGISAFSLSKGLIQKSNILHTSRGIDAFTGFNEFIIRDSHIEGVGNAPKTNVRVEGVENSNIDSFFEISNSTCLNATTLLSDEYLDSNIYQIDVKESLIMDNKIGGSTEKALHNIAIKRSTDVKIVDNEFLGNDGGQQILIDGVSTKKIVNNQ